ncbi:MAG: dihydrofolate reductase [Schleiferiaceae bacterium]|nr:dihydrofolate reductase [Schleiferiaceae bacterium]
MNLTMIAALAENRVIGKDNQLIWRFPNDLKRFKKLTLGHHVLMGRKTFESVNRPLPGRTNVVITQQKDYQAPGCIVVHTLEEALRKAENDPQPFVIGGAKIYELALPYTDSMELTYIHHAYKGDTYFPEWDPQKWQLTAREAHPADEKHPHAFEYRTYQKAKGQ